MPWPITVYKIDGFEHGSVVASAGAGIYNTAQGTPAIVTSPVLSGLRALEISAAAAAERVSYTVPTSNQVCQVLCIRFAALPTADIQLNVVSNANGNGRLIFDSATNRFEVNVNNQGADQFGPNPVVVDTWYILVTEFDSSSGNPVMRGKCFNATTGAQIGTTGSGTRAQTAAGSTAVSVGTLSAETGTFYADNWVISVTDGDFELLTAQCFPYAIESLIPNADGTHNITTSGDMDSFTGTNFSNATTTGFSFIDHRPLQLANTANNVIRQDLQSATTYMELLWEDLTLAGSPLAMRTYGTHVMSSTTGAPTAEARLLMTDGTEILTEGSISMIDASEDPGTTVTCRRRMAIAPAGGYARDMINNLKVRIGFNNIAADVNFIDLMLEVLLTPAAPPIPRSDRRIVPMLGPEVGW